MNGVATTYPAFRSRRAIARASQNESCSEWVEPTSFVSITNVNIYQVGIESAQATVHHMLGDGDSMIVLIFDQLS